MFIGLGLGMIFGNGGAGVIIGMGVGFILGSVIKPERKAVIEFPRSAGGAAMILVGLGFIALGLGMLGYLPQQVVQQAGGLIFIGIGILIVSAGGLILRRR